MEDITVLGIDLGTTNSLVAIWDLDEQRAIVLRNREGERLTPSVVAIDQQNGQHLIGRSALARMLQKPDEVMYSVKRFIGRTFQDEWVTYDQQHVTYHIEEAKQRKVVVRIRDQIITPPQISAEVLRKLREDSEPALGGRRLTDAIITVPAYFDLGQRQATMEAGRQAGLNVRWILNEPTAAALAFGLGAEPQTIAVYDLGGGTFDISILRIGHGLFRVIAISGDTHLGGDDFDIKIVQWIKELFERQHNLILPVDGNDILRARLRLEAEKAKIQLSQHEECHIDLPDLLMVDGKAFGLSATLNREILAELVSPLLERSLNRFDEALAKAKINYQQLDQILLVGGQTRSQAIKQSLLSRYPGCRLNDTINPDEAIAQGAAVLGARLCGYLKNQVKLLDRIPLSVGIELPDGRMDVIVEGNTPIPIDTSSRPKYYSTQRDGQERILFRIYQGDRPIARDNRPIGDVELKLAIARPKGEHRVECNFHVDLDGLLHVSARDTDTDAPPVQVTFDHVYRMTDEEIENLHQDADAHQEEDARILRLRELKTFFAELTAAHRELNDPLLIKIEELWAAITAQDIEKGQELVNEIQSQRTRYLRRKR